MVGKLSFLGRGFRAMLQEQVFSGRVRSYETWIAASRWYQDENETGHRSRTYFVWKR